MKTFKEHLGKGINEEKDSFSNDILQKIIKDFNGLGSIVQMELSDDDKHDLQIKIVIDDKFVYQKEYSKNESKIFIDKDKFNNAINKILDKYKVEIDSAKSNDFSFKLKTYQPN